MQTLKLVLQLLPLLIEAVKTLEQAFPEGGQGQKKLEVLKTIVQGVLSLGGEFEAAWPTIDRAVSGIVLLMNSVKR